MQRASHRDHRSTECLPGPDGRRATWRCLVRGNRLQGGVEHASGGRDRSHCAACLSATRGSSATAPRHMHLSRAAHPAEHV
jgi:hypothetical protein